MKPLNSVGERYDMEKLINTKKLAEKIPIPINTIRYLCRVRKLPCYKFSGTYFFRESEIEKWLEDRKQPVIKDFRDDVVREITVKS